PPRRSAPGVDRQRRYCIHCTQTLNARPARWRAGYRLPVRAAMMAPAVARFRRQVIVSGPLAGYRVMDLTHAAAGPWTTMLLGALGAEIYKIEPPDGDIGRLVPPPQNGLGAKHIHCSLNKKNAKLNLKEERDIDVARRLAATSDIV